MSIPSEPPRPVSAREDDQSVGQLLRELSEETSTLVRQEVQLAKAELSEKAKQAGKGAGLLAGAAVMGVALLGAFTAFLIAVIALALPVWLAALVVTIVYAVVVAVLALAGRSALRKATPVRPEQTIDTVKEDVQWAKTQAKSAKR
ncbi:MAG TPA: phage holin family protein [Jatrophihabitans sp.]